MASRRTALTQHCASHLVAAALPAPIAATLHRVLEHGTPDALLFNVASADVDVAVLKSQARSGRAMLGSKTENLLHPLDFHMLPLNGT